MALALIFSVAVVSAGFGALRALGIAKGALGFGLAPAAGLALLSIVTTWSALLNAPPPLGGVLLLCLSLLGLGPIIADHQALRFAVRSLRGEYRLAAAALSAALLISAVSMGIAFGGSAVPLSPHDGAYHTEVIQAHRTGQLWTDWYPQGTAALFAAVLELLPWLDSAKGALELGMALPFLAVVSVFGLGVTIWRDLLLASTAALLLSLTYVYPYFPELWSGWPLAIAVILVMGQWAVAHEYVAGASWRWAVLSGLLLGSVVLVHGSEIISIAIIVLLVSASVGWRLDWPRLAFHLVLAAGLAMVCAAPYLPTLVRWQGAGGAYAVGLADGQVLQGIPARLTVAGAAPDPFVVFGLGALGIDLPIRLVALAIGVVWAFRRRTGRTVFVVGALFVGITCTFTLLSSVPAVHQLYAATFPWGMHYRIFMVVAITQVLLAATGGVVALRRVAAWSNRPAAWARRLGRLTRLLVLTWVSLVTVGMAAFLAYPAGLVVGYTSDDAAAMAWLRQHASPGEMLANDGFADAGIWAPYKSGLPIVLPRMLLSDDLSLRQLIIDNVANFETNPDAAAAACALKVAYVYRGARASEWDARRFPPLDQLRASPRLQEVFNSGAAVIFRTRLTC